MQVADYQLPLSSDVCKNCRFWAVDSSDFLDVSECRRLPPVRSDGFLPARAISNPAMTVRERGKGIWPLVGEDGSCGEFKRRGRLTD